MKLYRYNSIKYIALLVLSFVFINNSESQMLNLPSSANFYDYMEAYYGSSKNDPNDDTEGGDVAEHRRLEQIWGARLHPHGDFSVANTALIDYATSYTPVDNTSDNANWLCIGPNNGPTNSTTNGVGQIHRISYDPLYGISNQTLYACSGYSGLWRSENDGLNWTNVNTDQLPLSSAADVAISSNDGDVLFLATGIPDYGLELTYGANMATVNPIFTIGVFRSTDYGLTWNPINSGLMSEFYTHGGSIRKLASDENNPNILFAATSIGIFRTQNALSSNPTWTKVLSGEDFRSVKFKPGSSSVLYVGGSDIYKSTNGGTTWTSMTGTGTGLDFSSMTDFDPFRINLAVSPANSNFVYAYVLGTNSSGREMYIYYYDNNTWNQLYNYSGYLGKSWMALAVSPINEYELYFYGYMGVYGSHDIINTNFTKYGQYVSNGIYADGHVLEFQPNTTSNPKLFYGHHGGVSMGDMTSANNWEFRNNGLENMLHWGFDDSEFQNDLIVTANQDCFVYKFESDEWKFITGAGGDSYLARSSKVNSDLFFFSNGGSRLYSYLNSTGQLTSEYSKIPYDILNSNEKTFITKTGQVKSFPNENHDFFTFSEVYKRQFDSPVGQTASTLWEIDSDVSKHITPTWKRQITEMDFCQADPNTIYIATVGGFSENEVLYAPSLLKTTVGGNNGDYSGVNAYQEITYPGINSTDFPVISGIAVHPNDPNKVWISMIGYDNISTRVAYSSNGGSTWVNADPTNSLPELPVNNIVYQYGSDDALYIATDVGVFYKTASMSNWERYGTFPHVRVTELKINYCQSKLRASTFGRSMWEADLLPMNSPTTYVVSNGETLVWESQKVLQSSLKIESGGTLRIKNYVSMPENSNITVEPGGFLYVDGGILTNACGNFWQGIIVEGQANLVQNQSNQGAVRISNGGVIENALYGVQLYKRQSDGEPIPTTGGGILIADGATFKNNKVAIAAGYYNYSGSVVQNSDLIIDDEYYTKSQTRPIFASLHNINLFGFSGNDFIYDVATTLAPTLITPIGIKSYNTKIAVNNNTFENLQYGVFATELNYSGTSDISNNTFTKNLTGIYMSGANSPQITFNSFEVMAYHPALPYSQNFTGVYLDGTYGHSVEENSFVSDVIAYSSKTQARIGLVINNGGQQSVEVFKNTFDHFLYAILAQNDNRSADGTAGLCFKCNDFNDNISDITVTVEGLSSDNGGVAKHQGNSGSLPTDPAGNLFSSLSSNVNWHFNNIDGVGKQITYHHHNASYNSRLVPLPAKCNNVQNALNQIAIYDGACLTNYTGGGIGDEKSAAKSRLDESKENELEATASLMSLTDNGDTPALQAEVATAAPNEAMEVRSELLEVAPYTSEEVLIEATQKEDVLNNALIRDVLVANPQAAKSEEVMLAIEDRSTAMPQYMKDQINQGLEMVSAKEELEATIFYNQTSYSNALSDMVFLLLSDTIGNPEDSVIILLEQSHYLYAKYQLADIYLNQKNASALNLVLENISNDFDLKDEFIIEYEQLQEYYESMLAVYNENRTIFELTATEKANLLSYYENSNNLAAINARNILNEIGEIEYTEPYIFPEEEMKSGFVSISDQNTHSYSSLEREMQVYPNPAKDYLICEYHLAKEFNACSLSIIKSGSGKSIYTQVLKHQQDAITIDLKEFTTGQYILILTTDGQVSHQTKFNIVK